MEQINQLLNIDFGKFNYKFPSDSILIHYNEQTPNREIFKAVCNEVGNFFTQYGFKYAPSGPKLEFKNKDNDLSLQFMFISGHSNWQGSHVNIEIIPNIYSKKLAQLDKLETYDAKGFLLGRIDLTYRRDVHKPPRHVTVVLLDGTIASERTEEIYEVGTVVYNANYNIYGISPENLVRIIQYMVRTAVLPFLKLAEKEYFIHFIENSASAHFGRDTERLKKYIELSFNNDLEILKALEEKIRLHKK
jgi:hypothetical protein